MFGTQWTKRRRKAEHVAEDALDNVRTAMNSTAKRARSTAKDARSKAKDAKSTAKAFGRRTHGLADQAQNRLGVTADEARKRANAAVDALAGRRPRTPWAWIAGSTMAGLLLGWAVATAGAKALSGALHRTTHDEELEAVTAPPAVGTTTTTGSTLPR
jgi:ElaB/YqjD/DUF883 family membrane-anchored ribosome-binding protein